MSVDQREINDTSYVDLIPKLQTFAEKQALQTIILNGNPHCVRIERVQAILQLASSLKQEPHSFESVVEFFQSLKGKQRKILDSICVDGEHAPITRVHAAQLWFNAYELNKKQLKE